MATSAAASAQTSTCARGGACVGSSPPDCDDYEACTKDACTPVKGCVHLPATGTCSDGSACSVGDVCQNAKCQGGPPPDCSDISLCTNDGCAPAKGCYHVPQSGDCDDGDACTANDSCKGGACTLADPVNCDDGLECTAGGCDKGTGCSHLAVAGACDDGDPCTVGDACLKTSCVAGKGSLCDDGKACTLDSCDAGNAKCSHQPTSGACDDGNACTAGETCASGACGGGKLVGCDDGNPCTEDTCTPKGGCDHDKLDGAPCDAQVCALGDQCKQGTCVAGTAPRLWSYSANGAAVTDIAAPSASFVMVARGDHGLTTLTLAGEGVGGNATGMPCYGVCAALAGGAIAVGTAPGNGYATHLGPTGGGTAQQIYDTVAQTLLLSRVVPAFGGYVLAGAEFQPSAGGAFGRLIQINGALGPLVSKKVTHNGGHELLVGLAVHANTLVAVGTTQSDTTSPADGWYVVYAGSLAIAVTSAVLGGVQDDQLRNVAPLPTGGFLAVGSSASSGAGGLDAWLVRIGADGKVAWQKTYGGPDSERWNDVAGQGGATLVVVGAKAGAGGAADAWIAAVDRFGNLHWQRTLGKAGADELSAIEPSGDGG